MTTTTIRTISSGERAQTRRRFVGAVLRQPYWSPYIVGAAIGVLSWGVFAIVNQPLGISTALSAAAGACAAPFAGMDWVFSNAYWAKTQPAWNYGMLFLVGTFLGALASSLVSRTFRAEAVPVVWRARFGQSKTKRFIAAFLGGALTLYGARLAGGCTSGHGISGTLQLAVSSWIFFITMFVAGAITALAIFGHRARPGEES